MPEKKKLRLLIIGLDGATFNVILPLIKKNKLKTLKKIMDDGVYGELESTIPPISSPAWTSFMTGKNPGNHGIFGFIDYDTQRYDGRLRGSVETSSSFSGSTFFDLLGSEGYKIGVITVPMTYPPWMINGIMISGYPCPYTERIYRCSENTQIEIKERLLHGRKKYGSEREEVSDAFEIMKRRTKIAIQLVEKMNLDCLLIVFGATDRMQHFFGVSDKEDGIIARCYQAADNRIAELLELADRNTGVFIMSDHGADPCPKVIFNTNRWLKELGLLFLNERKARTFTLLRNSYYKFVAVLNKMSKRSERVLQLSNKIKEAAFKSSGIYIESINWKNTKSFRYPMPATQIEGIVINVEGRQEKGIVKKGAECERLRDEIIKNLKNLRDPHSGKNVVKTCYKREEIYNGAFVKKAPDIVFQLNNPYVPGDGLTEIFTRASSSKTDIKIVHSVKGILMAKGSITKRVGKIKGANIIDLAPTILYSMRVSIPRNMDGQILYDIFTDEFRLEVSPKYHFERMRKQEYSHELTGKEREEIEGRLRRLGYI